MTELCRGLSVVHQSYYCLGDVCFKIIMEPMMKFHLTTWCYLETEQTQP